MPPSSKRLQTEQSPSTPITPEEKGSRIEARKRKLKSGGNALLTAMDALSDSDLFGEGEVGTVAGGMSRESEY